MRVDTGKSFGRVGRRKVSTIVMKAVVRLPGPASLSKGAQIFPRMFLTTSPLLPRSYVRVTVNILVGFSYPSSWASDYAVSV